LRVLSLSFLPFLWVQEIVTGAIIVAAVALDRLRHRDEG
jgi:ribose/xylose/arabinose/galactoside ABC-type transport system permease subunit